MSDEEEDYMSDAFLAKLQDVTPSLINNKSVKRKNELDIKKLKSAEEARKKSRPLHEQQHETLKEGLSKAITSDNKGFAMLSKMGFKAGMSLGKSSGSVSSTALTEPIKINLKTDGRGGLGTQTAIKEIREEQLKKLKQKMKASDFSADEYRAMQREINEKRQVGWDLRKLQKTCRLLDMDSRVKYPIHSWFWPEEKPPEDEESSEDELSTEKPELSDIEKLEMLRKFLRNCYFYCEFCGNQYTNAKDMLENCPGPLKDDH